MWKSYWNTNFISAASPGYTLESSDFFVWVWLRKWKGDDKREEIIHIFCSLNEVSFPLNFVTFFFKANVVWIFIYRYINVCRTQHFILWMTKKTVLAKIKTNHVPESLQLKIWKSNCCSMLRRLIPQPLPCQTHYHSKGDNNCHA